MRQAIKAHKNAIPRKLTARVTAFPEDKNIIPLKVATIAAFLFSLWPVEYVKRAKQKTTRYAGEGDKGLTN
ncbi:hypothetical protein J14TS5_49150 [Paenibacillus lautus]|nr:hypothetical protein J14TS5_49150 [Paenibacillus lautus]